MPTAKPIVAPARLTPRNLQAVDFTNATIGYAVGRTAAGTAPTVLKTTNGAAN